MGSTRHHVTLNDKGNVTRIDRDQCYLDEDSCSRDHFHVVAEEVLLDATFHGHPAFTWPT